MTIAEVELQNSISIPPKTQVKSGKAVHTKIDGGSQGRHGMGRFVILDGDRKQIL